jgi:hypothetical protein
MKKDHLPSSFPGMHDEGKQAFQLLNLNTIEAHKHHEAIKICRHHITKRYLLANRFLMPGAYRA